MGSLAVVPILLMSLAHGGASSQNFQLERGCDAAVQRITSVVMHAATAQPDVITAPLRVVTPGTLIGRIAFDPSGSTIHVAADRSASEGSGCAVGAIGPGVPKRHGHSHVVSTLRHSFTAAGTYTLTFDLNAVGRRILARLGAADRAYRERHPHGHMAPSTAFGVSLSYKPAD